MAKNGGFWRFARRLVGWTLALACLALFLVQAWYFAHVIWWAGHEPAASAFMDARLAAMQDKNPKARLSHQYVGYERISAHLKRAVVSSEDARFLEHEGFDWPAIQKALERNEKKGKVVAGGSTISQQLAKNLLLSGSRSLIRKGQEAAITWMIEATYSKHRILELYLNYAEWGEGVFGAEAAARYHFGTSAASLTASQAAYLAAILPAPRRYPPARITPYIASRVNTILARMPSAQIP